jgi:ferredoxin
MNTNEATLFEAFLNQHDDEAWAKVLSELLPSIHEVDRAATRIWFYFFPLTLARAFEQTENPEKLEQELLIQGTYRLEDIIDSSHQFLYGHRYWPEVKAAVVELATSRKPASSLDLAALVREISQDVAKKLKVDSSLTTGITAVAFMTLQQIGAEKFRAYPGLIKLERKIASRTPEQILSNRAKDDDQGLFGFLKGLRTEYTVTFNENDPESRFKLINSQHITTAAAQDKRPHHLRDSRCTVNEGPIPVQCRSASCGTCWIGVIGGAEKLSEVGSLERRRIREFGYIDTDEAKPVIRLACQSQASGAVSIVIPPWNGVFGKYLRRQKEEAESEKSAEF